MTQVIDRGLDCSINLFPNQLILAIKLFTMGMLIQDRDKSKKRETKDTKILKWGQQLKRQYKRDLE